MTRIVRDNCIILSNVCPVTERSIWQCVRSFPSLPKENSKDNNKNNRNNNNNNNIEYCIKANKLKIN